MRRGHWLLLVLAEFFAIPAACFAQAQCPWMNAATAGGFLGGDVQITVTGVNEDGDATCQFTRAGGSATGAMLRVEVHTMPHPAPDFAGYLAQCGAGGLALKGIGNQAVHCIASTGANKGEELIVGRVRERAFVITIKAEWITRAPTSPTKTRNQISDDSENIAEQVAGSMF